MGWLNGWRHRKSITLSRASGAVTNYQMKILVGESSGASGETVDCAGLCLSTFADIRFTNSDGETLLNYWIESITGTTPNQLATVWVKFDSIGTSDTTFYMYYENAAATSASNFGGTFSSSDDFEWGSNGDLISTSGGGVTWTSANGAIISTDQKYGGTRSAKLPYNASVASIICNLTASNNNAFRFMFYKETDVNWAYPILHGNGSKHIYLRITSGESIQYYDGTYHDSGKTITADAWNTIDIVDVDFAAGTFKIDVNDSGSLSSACAMNNGASYTDTVWIEGDGNVSGADCWLDNFIVRNYRSTEPAWGSWGAEESRVGLPIFSLDADIITSRTVSGTVSIPMQSVSGSFHTSRTMSGSIGIPMQQIDGSVLNNAHASLDMTLPALTAVFRGAKDLTIYINRSLPAVDFTLFGGAELVADLPMPTLTMTGGVAGLLYLDRELPVLEASFHGFVEEIGKLVADIPLFRFSMSATLENSMLLESDLPPLSASFNVLVGEIGQLNIALPAVDFLSSAHWTDTNQLIANLPSIRFSAHIVGADYKTLVLNVKNFALTEYDNSFNYNSIAFFNGKMIMAKSNGIYEQTGTLDVSAHIDWSFKTGKIDQHKEIISRIRHAWVTYRPQGDLILTVDDGDNEYEYPITEYSLVDNAVRVKLGKGFKNRYLQFKVSNNNDAKVFFNSVKLFAERFVNAKR